MSNSSSKHQGCGFVHIIHDEAVELFFFSSQKNNLMYNKILMVLW